MMVKICGITNREDALAAVEAGASALGFNFYRDSPRYISPTGASMIAAKIPSTVWRVGIFVNETPEIISRIALDTGLDVAQLHGTSRRAGSVSGVPFPLMNRCWLTSKMKMWTRSQPMNRCGRTPMMKTRKRCWSTRLQTLFTAALAPASIGREPKACPSTSSSPGASTPRMFAVPSKKPNPGAWMHVPAWKSRLA